MMGSVLNNPTSAVLSDGTNVLQINLNHCWTAQQLLTQTMAERKANIALISDYYKIMGDDERWISSADGKSAIFVSGNPRPTITDHGAGLGFAWARISNTIWYSCYCSPNCTLEAFDSFLAGLEASIRLQTNPQANLIVAGDFNAHSAAWGSSTDDARGSLLLDLASILRLEVCNIGSTPTYRRINAASVIDVTLVRPLSNRHPLVENWTVLDQIHSGSDHAYITYTVGAPQPRSLTDGPSSVPAPGWSVKKLNPALLSLHWDLVGNSHTPPADAPAENHADSLNDFLTKACDAAMPRRAFLTGKRSVYWWNSEIADLRKTAIAARRTYQRAGRRSTASTREIERENYNKARTELKSAIRKSQEKCWRELCSAVENDPWGVPYKLVTKRLGRRVPELDRDSVARIARGLFPPAPITNWANIPDVSQQPTAVAELNQTFDEAPPVPTITTQEIDIAVARLPTGKAPGPDLVPNEIIRLAYGKYPDKFSICYNACLANGVFPASWKRAKLVLLYKGQGKPRDRPSSYRPISLLDGAGKVFERILLNRLETHAARVGALSDSQHGFRRSRSTTGAIEEVIGTAQKAGRGPVQNRDLCVLVTLDVKNAFNSAPWRLIDEALRRNAVPNYLVKILRSYMEDRELIINPETSISVTCGVPQGSVIGPILWNLFYDGVLRLPVRKGVKLVAFADDLAVVAVAHNAELIEQIVNPTLVEVVEWMSANGLRLAPEKAECVVLTNKKSYRAPEVFVEGCQIPVTRATRYLGVRLDTRLSFVDHATTVAAGARKAAVALGRLMPNVGGPSQCKRQLLMSVVHSRLLYGAEVWAERVLEVQKSRNLLLQAQRCAALRVARCYRTVSDMASLVLARMPPVFLQAVGRKRTSAARKAGTAINKSDVTADVIQSWQALWETTPKASWTRRLIPDIIKWWHHGPKRVSYCQAQALTGHGCFQQYLWSKNRAHSPACLLCPAESDDAEHTLFVCMYWSGERKELEQALGRPVRPEDVQNLLCGPVPAELPEDLLTKKTLVATANRRRELFNKMVEGIMGRKAELERERQQTVG